MFLINICKRWRWAPSTLLQEELLCQRGKWTYQIFILLSLLVCITAGSSSSWPKSGTEESSEFSPTLQRFCCFTKLPFSTCTVDMFLFFLSSFSSGVLHTGLPHDTFLATIKLGGNHCLNSFFLNLKRLVFRLRSLPFGGLTQPYNLVRSEYA